MQRTLQHTHIPQVDIWEAVLTFAFFPILVTIVWLADNLSKFGSKGVAVCVF